MIENGATITPASISNVSVSGTGASLSTGAHGIDTITSQNGEFTMTLYTQAYGSHNAGDYSIANTGTTTESLGFTVNFTATDSSGNVSPTQSFTVNPVDLYVSQAPSITINEAATETLTGSIFTSVIENGATITPASISNVSVSGTGASLSTGAHGIDTITSQNGEFTMTLYTQAYGSHNAGDYSITNTGTTTESLGFTVSFTATDSSGNVSPAQSFSVNPVDLRRLASTDHYD